MKKVIVTMMAAFLVSSAFAQISKGAWLVGASSSLGFNSYSKTGSQQTLSIFNINAKAGNFVAENFAVGLNLGYLNSSQSSSSSLSTIGVFARYYIGKVFLGGGVNSVSQSTSGSSSGVSSIVLPFELGFVGFITDSFAIEPSINYVTGDDKGGLTYGGLPLGPILPSVSMLVSRFT